METVLLDGKEAARNVRASVKAEVLALKEKGLPAPKLCVIIVGEDPASQTYVANKEKACGWTGISSEIVRMSAETTQEELLAKIRELNEDPSVNGLLVQLPLPEGLDEQAVTFAIDPAKDVDGFHPVNVGKGWIGDPHAMKSCTPSGIIELLKQNGVELCGAHAVIAGRSNIVGKPMAELLLRENATVTVCHSRTRNLKELVRTADLFVAAIGRPRFFDGSYLKEGACVVDVGIHHTEEGLCGDVDTESCMGIASAITPVPGGVGPMTVAMLMRNTLEAYKLQNGLEDTLG